MNASPDTIENETAAAPEVAAITLLPDDAPKGKFTRIKIEDLRKMRIVGPAPSRAMLKSVSQIGVFEPLIVFKTSKDTIKIGDGIRRALAAIEAPSPHDDVPAMVYEDEAEFRHAITIMANHQRSANPLAEVKAINELMKRDYTIENIREATGLEVQRIKQRLQLNDLHEVLSKAMYSGKVAVSLCEKICKLPMKFQAKLAKLFEEQGFLKLKDYRHVKDVRQKAALNDVSDSSPEVFGSTRAERQAGLSTMERDLLTAYRQRRKLTGKKHAAAAKEVDRQITALETELVALEEGKATAAASAA